MLAMHQKCTVLYAAVYSQQYRRTRRVRRLLQNDAHGFVFFWICCAMSLWSCGISAPRRCSRVGV